MEDPEDEARIAAIVAEGRATRRRPSRALWLAAAIMGAVCAIGFVLLIVLDVLDGPALEGPRGQARAGDAAGPGRAPAPARRTGCAGGFGLGLGVGVAIGFALGARRRGGGAQEGTQDGA